MCLPTQQAGFVESQFTQSFAIWSLSGLPACLSLATSATALRAALPPALWSNFCCLCSACMQTVMPLFLLKLPCCKQLSAGNRADKENTSRGADKKNCNACMKITWPADQMVRGAFNNSCYIKVAGHTAAAALARASGSDTGAAEAWVLLNNGKTL